MVERVSMHQEYNHQAPIVSLALLSCEQMSLCRINVLVIACTNVLTNIYVRLDNK